MAGENERDIVLRISVDAEDIAPEVARLKAELAALDKATTDGANKSTAAQDKASDATRKRKGATDDLGKAVTAQGAAERKSLEERLSVLQKHQKELESYSKKLDEYKRKLAEIEASNRVAESRFRQGATRKLETQELPPEPQRPAISSSLIRNTTLFEASEVPVSRTPRPKRPVDQQAVNVEAKQIVNEEQAATEALAKAVNDERKRRPPQALPAPDPISAGDILKPVSSNDVMDQIRQSVTGAQKPAAPRQSVEQRVRDAYTVAKDKTGYAKIADLRDQLPDLSKDTLRTELLRMARGDESVSLARAPSRLPKRESEAAFRFRNERVDRLRIRTPQEVERDSKAADLRASFADRQAAKRAAEAADKAELAAARARKQAADAEARTAATQQQAADRYREYLAENQRNRAAAEPKPGLSPEQILAQQRVWMQREKERLAAAQEEDDDGNPLPSGYEQARSMVPARLPGEVPLPDARAPKAKAAPAPNPKLQAPSQYALPNAIEFDFFEKTDELNKFKQNFQAFVRGFNDLDGGNGGLIGTADRVKGKPRFSIEPDLASEPSFPGVTASSLQALVNKLAAAFDVTEGRAKINDDDGQLPGFVDIKARRRAAVTPTPEPAKAITEAAEKLSDAAEKISASTDAPDTRRQLLDQLRRMANVRQLPLPSRPQPQVSAASPYGDSNAFDRNQLLAQLRAAEAAEDAGAGRSAGQAPPPPPPPVEPPTPSMPDEPGEDPAARKARLAAARRERAAAKRREKREAARLDAEDAARAARAARGPLELDAPEERLAIGAGEQRAIPIERNRTGLDPFVMQSRERQRRDRYNVKRKERRDNERVVRDLVKGYLSQIEGINLDGPSAIESGGTPLQITGRPRQPIPIGRNRSGQGPFARGGGDAREADDAVDQLYNEFVNGPGRQYRRPELPGPTPRLAITDGSEQNTTKRRKASRDKVRIDIDCDYLHASIDKCLGRRGFKHTLRVDIDPNQAAAAAGASPAAGGNPGANFTGDPVAEAKLQRRDKAAQDAEAARVRKETAEEERAAARENRNDRRDANKADTKARKEVNDLNKDAARAARDAAEDAAQFTVDAKASAAEAAGERARAAEARADAAETARETARIRQEALKLANEDAKDQRAARVAAARESAESARLRTQATAERLEETRRRNERRRRLDEEIDARPKPRPRPPGLFRGISHAFSTLAGDARGATGRFLDTTDTDPDENTESAQRRITRRVLQSSGNSIGGLFRRPREPVASRFDVGGSGVIRDLKNVERTAEGVFATIKRGFKGAFGDKDGNNSGKRLLGGIAESVSNLGNNLASSFSGLGKTLFSFRGLIIAGLSALGPLVAMLGSLSAGALAAGNALFQLAAASAALPGLFLAAASGIGALVVAMKPLSGILSAYKAVQDATAKGTAATTKQQLDATRAQQDLNRARRDAKRELEDLNTELSRAKLTENGAVLSVKAARQRYLETLADPGASVLDQQLAYQGYQESKNSLADTRTKIARDREDASPAGQKKYGNDAQRKIEDAQTLADTGGNTAAKTAKEKLEAQLADASKSTKKFALGLAAIFLDDNSPWKKVQKATSEALFVPLVPELGNIEKLLGPIGGLLEKAAGALGGLFARAIEVFSKPPFTAIFASLADSNVKIIGDLGDAATSVAEAFLYIADAARPFTEWITGAVKGLAADFRDWAKAGMESGSIGEYLTKVVKPTLQQLGAIVGNLFGAFKNLFLGSNDFTKDFFGSLVKVTQKFEDWSESASDPNSGFRKFLRDTMPLLKQLGGFLVEVVQAFFKLASDPKNIKEAQKILTALSERVLPALVRFFSDLAESGLVSKLANAFGAAAEAIAALLENGGSTAIATFVTGVEKAVEVLSWFVSNPAVATILTTVGIALAALAAGSLFLKFTGLSSLVKLLGFLVRNKDNLGKVFGTILKFFGFKGSAPGTSSSGGNKPTTPGSPGGITDTDAKEDAALAGIRTQLTTIIGLLERIAACTCADDLDTPTRATPSTATAASGLNGAATRLTVAAGELIVAARALMGAAGVNAITSRPGVIPANVGNPIITSPRALPGATVPLAISGGTTAAATAATAFGPGGTRAAVNSNVINGSFTEGAVKQPWYRRLFSSVPNISSAAKPSFLSRALSTGGRFASSGGLALPGAALGLFADSYYQGEDRKSVPAQLARAGGAVLTGAGIGAQFGGPYGAIAGGLIGGAYSLYKDPGLRKTTNNYLQSPLGMFTSPGASLVSRALKKDDKGDTGIERVWDGAYEGFMRAVGSPLAKFFKETLPGFFGDVGDFFTKTLPDFAANIGSFFSTAFDKIGDFFTKTLPGLPGKALTAFNHLIGRMIRVFGVELPQAAFKFFTKTIPDLVEDGIRSFKKTFFDPAYDFFGKTLPRAIHTLFHKTIPNAFDTAVRFFHENFGLPIKNFIVGIPDFFTETIPKWFSEAGHWLNISVRQPIRDFIYGIPRFFTETIPNWFASVPGYIQANIIQPVQDFFGTTLPRFFTETLPNAIAQLPGVLNDNIVQPIISFFSAVPSAVGDFFKGNFDSLVDLAKRIFGRSTREVGEGYGGKQSGGLIEGTYDGRVDTKLVPLTIGEFVARKRVVDKPLGRDLFEDLNQERLDPADFYAALNFSARQSKNLSVNLPVMTLGADSTTAMTTSNTVNNRGGTSFGDVHIHNPVREKSDQSMRRTLHKLAYMADR